MKRPYVEISDDEWENHSSFAPSRALNKKPSNPPPPIESFAFRPSSTTTFHSVSSSTSSDDSLLAQVENFDGNLVDLEDEDVEEEVRLPPPPSRRGRKFVVDDEDSDGDFTEVVRVEEIVEESDVVGKALQNCAKISAELRSELYGSGAAACDRYSEVEASSVRIVTQVIDYVSVVGVFDLFVLLGSVWARSHIFLHEY